MEILEKFIKENAKNKKDFSEKVGSTPQKINGQIKAERKGTGKQSVKHVITYMRYLNINKFSGKSDGCMVEIKIF
jgi:hypothetical protein